MEKVVASQLTNHLTQHNLHDDMQSAYKRGTNAETAILRFKADMENILDAGECVLLILLSDLSAAFDTIDHSILIQRLQDEVGLNETALQWLKSYLSGRIQAVHINGHVFTVSDTDHRCAPGLSVRSPPCSGVPTTSKDSDRETWSPATHVC